MHDVPAHELVGRIQEIFPKLRFQRAQLADTGEDHAALILDTRYVFRFPAIAYRKKFKKELGLLARLHRRKLPFATPHYEWVAPHKAFGGYRFISGETMVVAAFRKLSPREHNRVAQQTASFLTALHTLAARAEPRQAPRGVLRPASYGTRYHDVRRRVIARVASEQLLRQMDTFFNIYGRTRSPHKTFIHADFRDEHIFMHRGNITGVIDFGDARVGDPAFDFSFLFEYGAPFVQAVYAAYRGPKDAQFLERARTHYLRWIIDELYYAIKNGTHARVRRLKSVLEKSLPR
ncbi:MAG: phosphotransferase [Patescibacteria group bacterium]|nr:phosphotransferase [Patescibacteria group bacterium]